MDNLNDILIFTKVVEQGSFTAAAERLELPKSSVSRAVSRLEERLGAELLRRSTRQLRLTEIGQRYYDHCRRIVQELEEANSVVASYQAQPSGLIRITAPYILGQAFLGMVLAEYMATYPDVTCHVELSNRRIDLIEEGFDVAIRVGELPDSSLKMIHLGRANGGSICQSHLSPTPRQSPDAGGDCSPCSSRQRPNPGQGLDTPPWLRPGQGCCFTANSMQRPRSFC